METMKKRWRDMPLRRFLILTVCISIGAVALVSVFIVSGCAAFQHWLLPDPDAVYLTVEQTMSDGTVVRGVHYMELGGDLSFLPFLESVDDGATTEEEVRQIRYSIEKIETGVESLTPKRKFAYRTSGIVMVAAPTVLAFAAIVWCSMFFYRRKLRQPLQLLADATKQISEQNLDFAITYRGGDEMGKLCRSFDAMRAALHENYRTMWHMLEERRLMQASVAHDLRNPIAIIEGYAEYLEQGLKNGVLDREKMTRIARNLGAAAKRLEQYTESVRLINQSEETTLDRKSVNANTLVRDLAEDLSLLAEQKGIALVTDSQLPDEEIEVDDDLLYRVLENLLNNALRYASQGIRLGFFLEGQMLRIVMTDDGPGFPPEILNGADGKLLVSHGDGHMGIGLSVSRLLCRKHGGKLELSNTSEGACVKIMLSV